MTQQGHHLVTAACKRPIPGATSMLGFDHVWTANISRFDVRARQRRRRPGHG